MAKYVPWYYKRSPPIFCGLCLPVYVGIWPARNCAVIFGAILFMIGVLLLFALLLTCLAVECSAAVGALLPFALILIIAGILILHCGWAARLIELQNGVPIIETTKSVSRTTRQAPGPKEEELVFEDIEGRASPPVIRQGFWQFDDKPSWQDTSGVYPINYTLKPVIDRQPYVPTPIYGDSYRDTKR